MKTSLACQAYDFKCKVFVKRNVKDTVLKNQKIIRPSCGRLSGNIKTRVGGLPPIFNHREELKLRGEAEHF